MDGVPEALDEIIHKLGIYVPDDVSPEAKTLYDKAIAGHCMLCESDCGETTCLIVNDLGVTMVFCCQVCLQDFLNMHWLMSEYDDRVEAAKFRNQRGNN